jgi:hypothetical protein
MFNIQKNTYRTTETMGMCIVMMGNAVHEADYLMSDEALSFMYSINDADSWDLVYSRGDWNMVKCEKSANWDVIEEAGRKKILDYTLDTLLRAPDQSIKAFLDVTGMIWKVDGDRPWLRAMDDYDSNYQSVLDAFDDSTVELMDKYDVNSVSALYINEVIQLYRATVRESFMKYIFCYIGLLNLILLVVCFAGIKEKGDLRKILYILPIMCYSYGTAILLSGYDLRFFSYTYVCFFPALFLLFKKNKVSDEENLDCE